MNEMINDEEIEYIKLNINNKEHENKINEFYEQVSKISKLIMTEFGCPMLLKIDYYMDDINWLRAEIKINSKLFRRHSILYSIKKYRENYIFEFLDCKFGVLSEQRSFDELVQNVKNKYFCCKEEM